MLIDKVTHGFSRQISREKPNVGKLVQLALEGFHYYAKSKYNNPKHQNWFTQQRNKNGSNMLL